MLIAARLIGLYVAGMGILFLVNPKAIKPYVGLWQKGKRLIVIGGSRIVMGVILLLAASQCRLRGVVSAIGILMILAGLPYFVVSLDKQKKMTGRWRTRSVIYVRILGLAILAVGVLLIYAV